MDLSSLRLLLQRGQQAATESRAIRAYAMTRDIPVSVASLDDLHDGRCVAPDEVPIGSVEFVRAALSYAGFRAPQPLPYLSGYLHRHVWPSTAGEVRTSSKRVFVKPRDQVKTFTGILWPESREIEDLAVFASVPDHFPVYCSEPVKWLSEWRYYVLRGRIVGSGRYDCGPDDAPTPDRGVVESAVAEYPDPPAGYALDFGVLASGETAMVEANDGWALGLYRGDCATADYVELLAARWREMVLGKAVLTK